MRAVYRYLLIGAGLICTGLAFVGIFAPLLPTTPLLLVAAACFSRSSEGFHKWLITNRIFGRYIRDYREEKGIRLRIKVMVLVFLWITILSTVIFFVELLWIRIMLLLIAAAVSIHILLMKTIRENKKKN